MKKYNSVGVIAPTFSKAGEVFLSNLLRILDILFDDVYLISGNKIPEGLENIKAYNLNHTGGYNPVTQTFKYFLFELRIANYVRFLSKKVDLWFFFIGGENMLAPMIIAKIFGHKTILLLAGYIEEKFRLEKTLLLFPLILSKKINLRFSDRIILYSPNLIKEWNLEKYRNKISIAHEHFLDFDKFKMKKKFGERDNLVGYIGRLSEEKGTLNFVKAIPEISKEKDDLEFLIGGDGQLCDKIKKYLDENNLNDKVNLTGWIPHDKLPDYLNELKLVVLPSYTEGLPNLMLEAMACDTPVLATPVGAIQDLIKDGETGFILEDNSPECIARNVIRALEYPNLEEIVKNARELVEKEYTYEAAVDRYRKILENLGVKNHE